MAQVLAFLVVALTVLPGAVLGQETRKGDRAGLHRIEAKAEGHLGTQQQQRACRPDVLRHCRGMTDDFAMAECLKSNEQKLSSACRRALESDGK